MTEEVFHAILASIEPQQILDLSVCKGGISTESGGNVVVNFSHVSSFKVDFGLILQTMENDFKIGINYEGNFELVLPTVKSHEGIFLGHVCPHCFIVYAIFEVLISGLFALKSLEAVQGEEVVFVLVLTVTACE